MPKHKKRFSHSDGLMEETGYETLRRKKKIDPMEQCHELYETIRNFKTDEGRLLCESFIRAPKRRNFPDYYELVSSPIDLLRIQQKIRTDEYDDVDQMTSDIELMSNSQEYKDACDLWDLFVEAKQHMIAEELRGSSEEKSDYKGKIILKMGKFTKSITPNSDLTLHENNDEDNLLEELFSAVMMVTNVDGQSLSTDFQLLPSQKRYPEYYKIIENPIDLKIIATKLQAGRYQNLDELEQDLLLMTRNACTFNEPGSKIYRDARALRKLIQSKKIEIEHSRNLSSKCSERIRSKRKGGSVCLSATVAALNYETEDNEATLEGLEDIDSSEEGAIGEADDDDLEEEEEEELDDDEASRPQWQLYKAVLNYTNYQGYQLSEPFLRLPSRRLYPDYYKEIPNPISMAQIRTRIMKGQYPGILELAEDFFTMFQNAKQYNRPDSRLYKDAIKLHKIMQNKLQELLDSDREMESDDGTNEKGKRGFYRSRFKIPKARLEGGQSADPEFKKRLRSLFRLLIEYKDEHGRQLISAFLEKPSRKLYPDYYQIISDPIDMNTIEQNIRQDKYNNEDELLADFRLMFANCRQYNEESSIIYHDAEILEKFIFDKIRATSLKKRYRRLPSNPKLMSLYETLRDYKDARGRQVSAVFMKLPSRSEYPDYYEVIRKPIDLERIYSRLRSSAYDSLDDLLSDFVLMFDNACKYNEPDSQIYKDALTLQRLALQTKLKLQQDEESIPDVAGVVQELLTSLFAAVYNHCDVDGRCYSDSLLELPEYDDGPNGTKIPGFSLDLIKRHLDRGVYKRLDHLQQDMCSVFRRARALSRIDSQVFEDSVEMQLHMIRTRDELCQGGGVLNSPALQYTLEKVMAEVENAKQDKISREDDTDSMKSYDEQSSSSPSSMLPSPYAPLYALTFNQQTYQPGEFVYVEPQDRNKLPHIIQIERLLGREEARGELALYGRWYYHPSETFHLPTRKFLEKEVFKTDVHSCMPLSSVVGKCAVLFVRDFFRYRPEGFHDADVYVCESRYSSRSRSFVKMKSNTVILQHGIELHLVPREVPLEMRRVASVFKTLSEKDKEASRDDEELDPRITEKPKPNVEMLKVDGEPSRTYYEQYNLHWGALKVGDCVYVQTEQGRQLVAQIEAMWISKETGIAYFQGPWFVSPQEIPHTPTRMFYKQELFLSSIEDTNPLLAVTGRCAVLEYDKYTILRPTEISEDKIYVCESLYDEGKRQVRKLTPGGLREYVHSSAVQPDELYRFRKPVYPQREPSPHLPKINGSEIAEIEDSLDSPLPSLGSVDVNCISTPPTKKMKLGSKKMVTGYILFSSEMRKSVVVRNPDANFGEISRIVGNEWRNLSDPNKREYEDRAQKMNEEVAAQKEAAGEITPGSPATVSTSTIVPTGAEPLYECGWNGCTFQFEELIDYADHLLSDPGGHVFQSYGSVTEANFQCLWRSCSRIKKNMPPFPNVQRLVRHVREVHVQKAAPKYVLPQDRSRHYIPSRRQNAASVVQVTSVVANQQTNNPSGETNRQEPVFVGTPPRTQRLLHSEAYIRYIEGLSSEHPHISDWEKTFVATKETVPYPPDPSKLPSNWFNSAQENIIDSLWALRDYMLRDAFSLSRFCT